MFAVGHKGQFFVIVEAQLGNVVDVFGWAGDFDVLFNPVGVIREDEKIQVTEFLGIVLHFFHDDVDGPVVIIGATGTMELVSAF